MLCRNIDPKDTDYVALSLQLAIPLLTRDKGYTNIVLLDELFAQTDDIDSTN